MKLALAIAGANALPSAFVVFRGFEESIRKAARLGYDGVELALKDAQDVDPAQLAAWLQETGLEVACISTGQVFADSRLMFTDPVPARRERLAQVFERLIDMAADFGRIVNIGRVRGSLGRQDSEAARQRFVAMARALSDYAAPKGVTLVIEPVNRYEIDFINSVSEGAAALDAIDRPNAKLMPDVFHMNIEDAAIGAELARHAERIGYIHLADSNRLAPGQGHLDFDDVFDNLGRAGYDGWTSVEILPRPDPDTAARQAVEYLRPRVDRHNARRRAASEHTRQGS